MRIAFLDNYNIHLLFLNMAPSFTKRKSFFKSTSFDGQEYITPSWEDMGKLSFALAKSILNKNVKIDRLVALAKGGVTWSGTLLDYLNLDKISVFQIKFYTDIYKKDHRPIIVQSLPVQVENENILLVDDVVDSGETIQVAKSYLAMCGAKTITTASLFIKPWSKTKPDFYAESTKAWIIFPHEIREMITLLHNQWKKNHLGLHEIKQRLISLGIPKNEVTYFLSRIKN